jgi:hypothetical protein
MAHQDVCQDPTSERPTVSRDITGHRRLPNRDECRRSYTMTQRSERERSVPYAPPPKPCHEDDIFMSSCASPPSCSPQHRPLNAMHAHANPHPRGRARHKHTKTHKRIRHSPTSELKIWAQFIKAFNQEGAIDIDRTRHAPCFPPQQPLHTHTRHHRTRRTSFQHILHHAPHVSEPATHHAFHHNSPFTPTPDTTEPAAHPSSTSSIVPLTCPPPRFLR